jgi:hypothetical protein
VTGEDDIARFDSRRYTRDLITYLVQVSSKSLELLNGQLPSGGNGKGVYKHSAIEIGLVRSVDCEHGNVIDLIVPAPTTHH